ncbi:MAG: nucleoside-diphosphate kinase [Candidatus Moraniibacteriota bacterium]
MSAAHPKKERTLVILKPDAIQRSLIGEVIRRIERTGLKLVAVKFMVAKEEQCWEHYQKNEEWYLKKGQRVIDDRKAHDLPIEQEPLEYGKDIIRTIVEYMTSGPVLGLVVEGLGAVAITTKLVGSTEPSTSDVGTIRGDFTIDTYSLSAIDNRAVRNLIHCSDSPEEAGREIAIWFKPEELINYRLVQEQILYDVNLDGILE